MGYSLTWKSNISQTEPSLSLNERRFERVRCARHVSFPSLGQLEMMNGVAHKKPISGSAASRTSDYRVRLQFVEKIWERVCGKECRDLSTFHYSREAYGPRIDLLPSPFHLFPFSLLFLPLPFPLRYVTREKEAFCHIPKLSKSKVTPLKISPSILQILEWFT